jgi:hypothetical protein
MATARSSTCLQHELAIVLTQPELDGRFGVAGIRDVQLAEAFTRSVA